MAEWLWHRTSAPYAKCGHPWVSVHGCIQCPIRAELEWTVWNVLVPDFSSDIRTLVHHAVIVFLKSFSCHLPRRQCSQLDRLRQWSPFGAFPCSPRHPVRVSPVAKRQAATPKQRVLSPSHLL
ncbi:hypothetical protein TNCV_4893541 [Trichonephila clavipes]|nr:hypothetical protein TNCV_4893541 [Trichonephila clavipes]